MDLVDIGPEGCHIEGELEERVMRFVCRLEAMECEDHHDPEDGGFDDRLCDDPALQKGEGKGYMKTEGAEDRAR